MDLLAYFRVLRRHWWLIVVTTLVGAALGASSMLLARPSSERKIYYRATHTLVFDASGQGSSQRRYSNPNQIAILTTTGDVPNRVAEKLGASGSGPDIATRITTTTNQASDTLDIAAIDPDANRATLLADTFASELIASLNAKELDAYTVELNTLSDRLNNLKTDRDSLLSQLAANPNDQFLQGQYSAAASNYSNTFQQYLQRNSLGAPTAAVSTLEPAQAVPITRGEYEALLSRGETGRNHFQSEGDNTFVAPAAGSSFNDPVSRGVLGGLLGLLAGVGLALVAEKLDRRVRTREDAEAAFELPVVAEVPRLTAAQQRQHEIVASSAPLSRAAEAYRAARTSLLFLQTAAIADRAPAPRNTNGADGSAPERSADSLFEPDPQGPLVVMVTSASPGEGKTTTSANLAAVFGEAGARVLVLNCDFRRPSVHEMFRVRDEPRRVQATDVPGVKVVTNVAVDPGSNPAQVVAAQRQVIAAARSRFDVVILDTAPLLTANDAVEVVSSADLVLLVARPELTTMDAAQRSIALLTRFDASIAGVVLVAASDVTNDYYYYYRRGRVPDAPKRRRSARAARSNGKAGAVTVDASIDPVQANDIFVADAERSDEPRAP